MSPVTGKKVIGRIFGVHPRFDGVAAHHNLFLRQRQRFTLGHGDLPGYQVNARDHFGDGVLHLQRVFISRK
jgi:hypothetical protein